MKLLECFEPYKIYTNLVTNQFLQIYLIKDHSILYLVGRDFYLEKLVVPAKIEVEA